MKFMNDRAFQKVVTAWMAAEAYSRLHAITPAQNLRTEVR